MADKRKLQGNTVVETVHVAQDKHSGMLSNSRSQPPVLILSFSQRCHRIIECNYTLLMHEFKRYLTKLSDSAGEIDRCLKKVAEGVEQFEDIWQKVRSC